ncbi:protein DETOXIFICATION 16 isoform X2 [Physcomitrium patens]|uniref:Protein DETOXIFICATION n=1 Tax=Physcomitrium patens TaxID=3218 RepID=A0A2K1KNT2_PHYPA|nr:protein DETOXIFICATION 16-like isoform X1 [Physcomitrium patens]PNR55421.1 hypothetical protein PHYPA_006318 [Physcomitrium patens]|eukprot:XP_024374051.1 protein DETOXIFICATION 16-like isoform X1 [Physcomitrella patens]
MTVPVDIPRRCESLRQPSQLSISPAASFPSRGSFFRAQTIKNDHLLLHSPSHDFVTSATKPLIQSDAEKDGYGDPRDEKKRGAGDDGAALLLQTPSLPHEVVRQCWIAGPMICVNLLQYSITVLSVMFVGHLGELELASASIANSVAGVMGYYVLLGMGSALETLCGQAHGAAQYHMLGVYLQRAFLVLFTTCIPLSLVFLYMENILCVVGQDPEIAKKAGEYALYLLPSLFGYALMQPVVKFLQTQSIILPMVLCSVATLTLHASILYIFIYTLGLGFRGAAIATSLSIWVNAILLILYVKLSGACEKTWKTFSREAFNHLHEFLRLAIPSCVMICLEYWCFEILVMAAGLLPNPQLELSSLSVCLSTITLNYMIPFGLSAAASTRVSNELGARDAEAAKQAVRVVIGMSAFQATIVASFFLALRFNWGWLFSNEFEVVHYVGTIMPLLACVILFDGIQGVLSGVVRGCGIQGLGAMINLWTFYGVGVPTGLILAFYFKFAGRGLIIGLLCGLGTQMLTLFIVIFQIDWNKQIEVASGRLKYAKLDTNEKAINDIM